ncbi:receptor-type tyrosine-protein phosphatase alpha-like [Dysidea avara]|uniref:receptor-type tyrosine-protein phosphatase alpha-like n=1 Tax=Dysidea avara TaxID=196820 RepID=UPI003318C520
MLGPVETKSLPLVNIKEQEVKTSVGQPTTLYIEARGNPPPEISWTKNGLPVNDPLLQNGSLYIHSTTHSDQGTYTVTATSDEGSTSEAIKLLVLNPQYVPSNRYKPIKVENFAEHLAMLHSSMNQQFTTDYDSLVVQNDFSFNGAKLEINVMKNRYKNILPYDHARVPLTLQDKLAGTDYINASFIDGYNERKAYIACQGPMASTMAEFWRMIWEQNVTTIVMVTNLTEEGKPKCQQYWPEDVNKSCTYGNISVTLIQEEVLAEYTIRTLAVKMIEASSEAKSVNLEVQHFHFTVWPDHGVPKYPTALLSFQKRVNKHHKRKRGSPLVVHCSAGVGRTGTFITIDMELQHIKHEAIVDVYNTVHKLRFRRSFTVQTLAQYVFIFDALMESIMCGDNSIAAPAKSAKLRLEELAKVNPATKLSGYESQFRKLQAASPKESDFQYICANLPENRHKNRSIKHLAPDNSRVYINTAGYNSDYICASYIDGYRHRKAFLATEGPMNSTVIDFWGMIWDKSSHAIVMLSLLEENGKETSVKYWPDKGETLQFGPFVIETTNESKSDKYFARRIMQVKNTSSKDSTPRTINQFQYLCWPDHSCPSEASSIMDMVEIVETVQRKSKNGPITVHCSDGLGRTGTFCALMQCYDRFKTEHMADVFYAIKTMRAQRPGMVENTAQYEFIHKTLKETMDRLETYSNF